MYAVNCLINLKLDNIYGCRQAVTVATDLDWVIVRAKYFTIASHKCISVQFSKSL